MSPEELIDELEEPRRGEVERLHGLIASTLPGLRAEVASGMIGYGPYHYRYESGREGDSHLVSLASRKQHISIYVQCSVEGRYLAERYVERLPKASVGKSCIRFKRTDDVDLGVLRELLAEAGRLGPAASS